ncbi:hypothetical protein ABN028_15995 [Actinopolymorpha sp. B17G11]|uniref:hypothetical protein n=1 Tax=Actinopolymorpha sp. B17G11 TaxID=3160861 RepID=UPI0032E46C2D
MPRKAINARFDESGVRISRQAVDRRVPASLKWRGHGRRGGSSLDQVVERLRAEHEAGRSTAFRNRRQLVPHLIAAGLFAVNAVLQLLVWLTQSDTWASSIVFYATMAGLAGVGLVAVFAAVPERWRTRAGVATLASTAWLTWAAQAGIGWVTTAVLMCGYYLLAARWWQYCRPDYPDGPQTATPVPVTKPSTGPDRHDIAGLWQAYIGSKNGPLPGSSLHSRVIDEHRESWTVELVPGQQSLDKALAALDRIQTGLRRAQEEIIIETHQSRDSAQLTLTVITRSPIKDTVSFDGPQYFWDAEREEGWIEPGWYADGEGRVRVGLYAPNSARHLVIFGGQGSGKTALLNSLALSAKASGHTVVWYLDGQDGTSSPQLLRYADWAPTGVDRGEQMLAALERVFAIRGKIMQARRVAGLTPSPELPGLMVVIDECHLIFDHARPDLVRRWVNLASLARKLCVSFVAATQHPELKSFGDSDKLRSLLQQYTTLVLRTTSGVANNILRLQVDPSKLPSLPGYGYLVAGDQARGVRSAPFRADFLDDRNGAADTWFEAHPGVALDKPSAKAAGPVYHDRAAIAEQHHRDLENDLASWLADVDLDDEAFAALVPTQRHADSDTGIADGPLELAPVVAFPTAIVAPGKFGHESNRHDGEAPVVPDGLTESQLAAYVAICNGNDRATDVAAAIDLGPSQTYKLLGELVDAGHISKARHGRYQTNARIGQEEPARSF